MAVKPEDLDEDTSPNDNDIVMKTNSNHATRTIKFSNIWSWIWTKVYNKIISSEVTLHAIDEAKPYQPVDSTAVINSAISALDTSNPAPVNSTAVNGALTNLADYSNYEVYTGGKWKDGKWIYKKTYSYPLSFITANTWANIEGGQTQIDTIVKAELTCGNTSFSGFICQVTSGLLRMYSPVGVNLTDFTVWYTKN